jgi:hypothetical protein
MLLLALLMLGGCNKIENKKQEWKCKIDGVQYEWEGNKDSYNGTSSFTVSSNDNIINLISLGGPEWISFEFRLPNLNVGTQTFSYSGGFQSHWCALSYLMLPGVGYNTLTNYSSMNIAITESTPERVKGTFSGTLTRENPNNGDIYYTQITDGYFESIIE